MAQTLEHLVLSTVRCFCVVQKQKGVADAMIEAKLPLGYPPNPILVARSVLLTVTAQESARLFTLPSIQPHLRLMLADTLFPHGSSVSLAAVGPLSEGFRRRVAVPPFFVGYCRWDGRSGRKDVPPDNHSSNFTSQTPSFKGS